MLSKEMREILVKAFNEIHDADKVAEIFNVSRRTVYTYVEKAREGESLEVRTSERGRKAILWFTVSPRPSDLPKPRLISGIWQHFAVPFSRIRLSAVFVA